MAIKSKKVKITGRARSKIRIRKKVSGTDTRPRVSVFRSAKHSYAQAISDSSGKTLASASTCETEVQNRIAGMDAEGVPSSAKSRKSVIAAKAVGMVLAERCKAKNIEQAVFDRNGYTFRGRVKAVADGARAGGLKL